MAGPEEAWPAHLDRGFDPCQMGPTSGCKNGRHKLCNHSPNGQIPNGVVIRNSVLMPVKRGGHMVMAIVAWVEEPKHVYRCSCECHRGEVPAGMDGLQLDLFEGAT